MKRLNHRPITTKGVIVPASRQPGEYVDDAGRIHRIGCLASGLTGEGVLFTCDCGAAKRPRQ